MFTRSLNNLMRKYTNSTSQSISLSISRVPRRGLASGGKKGPYDPKTGSAYPNEAYPFGLVPGKKNEGWEYITYACYTACFVWLTVGLSMKDDDLFTSWARREALAREKAREDGEEIEFGKYYSNRTSEYQDDGDMGDTMPVPKEE